MRLKILLTIPENATIYGMKSSVFAMKLVDALDGLDCEITLPKSNSEEEMLKLAKDADVIIVGGGVGRVSGKVIDNAEKLKLIQSTAAGVDDLPFESISKKKNVLIARSPTNGPTVAEHAFALMLSLCKHVVYQHNLLKNETWHRLVSIELYGKTLGVVGLGIIGVEVAKRAKSFGMSVVAAKRHIGDIDWKSLGVDLVVSSERLIEILKISDFVVVCLPSTPETKNLFGEKEFRSMKRSAYLINVSRGSVVDEQALYRALKEKWIAGAGLDTWYNYPPRPEHNRVLRGYPPSRAGIHLLENVVMTPHVGGLSYESVERSIVSAAKNIERVAKGEEIMNKVNIELRY